MLDSDPARSRLSDPRPLSLSRELCAVAAGGVLGASLRFGLGLAVAAVGLPETLGTAVANASGAFVLGASLARFTSPIAHPLLRPFWVVGVCGSFTTFSTLAAETHGRASVGGAAVALLHLGLAMAIGMAAFALGDRLWRSAR